MAGIKLTTAMTLEIDKFIKKFSDDYPQSAVVEALHIVQRYNNGWLSEDLLNAIADYLALPRINVYEIATFYNMFELKPVGKYKICVCSNLSCMLCGSKTVADYLVNKLNISFGGVTLDGKFSLKQVECMAACDTCPVISINNKQYTNITPNKIDAILATLK